MARQIFNGIRTDEDQEALTNKELYDQLSSWIVDDEGGDTYIENGKVWFSTKDRFGQFMSFDVTGAGFACISPDFSLSGATKRYGDGKPRRTRVDNPEVHSFLLTSDGIDTWGTITASEQLFELRQAWEPREATTYSEGYEAESYWHLAYCEPFKPNEPTEIIVVYSDYAKFNVVPMLEKEDK